ncbi:MAG: biosynthetic arginine decarboxylase [Deltaproteobacteria bacterium]|nr:biosynthetic arginine decarboxylase [Deltaproteobacteria bacterium]
MILQNNWNIENSLDQYLISRWGAPYFSINEHGNLTCDPTGRHEFFIDLKELVDNLCRRGIQPPLLIRFNDLLGSRVRTLFESFDKSIRAYDYKNSYRPILPIKVNQQRHVIEELVKQGRAYNLGLEAGSKPELLIAMALLEDTDSLLLCNGYKDAEYIETALDAQRLGLKPFLILDRFAELQQIIQIAKAREISPHIGIRAKLSTRGKGRWEESSGDRSKFGLTSREIVEAVKVLEQAGMLDCLELIHFHIGSQITAIRSIKNAAREAAHLYCNLRRMGCENLSYVDIGGGLAIDYDGSRSDFHSSMNYSVQEYADDIVATLQEICDEDGMPHPGILSESGRALVAHHAVLIFNVLGVNKVNRSSACNPNQPAEHEHSILHTMWEAYECAQKKRFQEAFNDIQAAKEESVTLFSHGVIDLETKAKADDLYWSICQHIHQALKQESYVPEDLKDLGKKLSDTYYCNFSLFQSMPDSWAVDHLFPIAPIHRLNEEPTREAVLADLTCDSDGKIDHFIDLQDVKSTLRLHAPDGKPYYLGAFLVGAYQEILGDLHNLFGDTNAVHVSLRPDGTYLLEHLVQGDTVSEVLSYVEYDRLDLLKRIRNKTENAVREQGLTFEESAKLIRRYEEGLSGYTYLEDID